MRRNYVVPGLLTLAVAAGVWGYNQYQYRQSLQIEAENQYARAFQELSYYVDGIETLSAKALVSTSRLQRMKAFSDIWRNAYSAQAQIGQLPLTNVPLKRTENFLAKIGAFTYELGIRNLDGSNKITEKEWKTLKDMNDQAKYLNRSLNRMNSSVVSGRVDWTKVNRDVLSAAVGGAGGPTADRKALGNNPVVKSFVMMEDGLSRFPDPDFEGNRLNYQPKPKFLVGPVISRAKVLAVANGFLGPELLKDRRLRIVGRTSGMIPSFSLVAERRSGTDQSPIRLDVTQKGGHVMWMLNQRTVSAVKYTLEETERVGLRFLESRGLKVVPVAKESFENVGVHSYAAYYGGYVIYPELIKVQVARDNKEILGVDSVPYLTFHEPNRKVVSPAISQNDAQKMVDKHVKLHGARKAIVLNDRYDQVACYEFDGTLGNDQFKIFVNTKNGDEEKISRNMPGTGYQEM